MHDGLRLCFLAFDAVGPAVALLALLRRRRGAGTPQCRVVGWRGYIPVALLPVEWLLPPVLIFFGLTEAKAKGDPR